MSITPGQFASELRVSSTPTLLTRWQALLAAGPDAPGGIRLAEKLIRDELKLRGLPTADMQAAAAS